MNGLENKNKSNTYFMDQQIFNLNLSVIATSLYILICSFNPEIIQPSYESIKAKWNTSEDDLQSALAELIKYQIIEKMHSTNYNFLYIPNPASLWV